MLQYAFLSIVNIFSTKGTWNHCKLHEKLVQTVLCWIFRDVCEMLNRVTVLIVFVTILGGKQAFQCIFSSTKHTSSK